MELTTYRVTARRTGDWWALEVPELPGVFTQSKRLDTATESAREAIGLMLDTDPDSIQVVVEPQLPERVQLALDRIAAARAARKAAEEAERGAMQAAARTLTDTLSQRDAGKIIGVSFQRISQLLKEPTVCPLDVRPPAGDAWLRSLRHVNAASSVALAAAWSLGSGNSVRALIDKSESSFEIDYATDLNRQSIA